MFINNLNPVAFEIFDFEIRWYSLAYIFGIIIAINFGKFLIKKNKFFEFKDNILEDYIPLSILGIIFGGRIGYVIFYDFLYYIKNPIKIFYIWEGGMSFHGGLLGIIISAYYFSKKNKINFYSFADILAVITPIGLMLGRIANFINSELIGSPTNLPWAVTFSKIDSIPRHPSQLYEAFLEGIVLFLILNYLIKKIKYTPGIISSSFLFFYGFFRIISEQFRLPDQHIGYIIWNISMGSLLSCFMIAASIFLFFYVKKNNIRN